MGEKLEDLGTLTFGVHKFSVEANLGVGKGGERDIHIQNMNGRFQMYEKDYLAFIAKIISARNKIAKMKRTAE